MMVYQSPGVKTFPGLDSLSLSLYPNHWLHFYTLPPRPTKTVLLSMAQVAEHCSSDKTLNNGESKRKRAREKGGGSLRGKPTIGSEVSGDTGVAVSG